MNPMADFKRERSNGSAEAARVTRSYPLAVAAPSTEDLHLSLPMPSCDEDDDPGYSASCPDTGAVPCLDDNSEDCNDTDVNLVGTSKGFREVMSLVSRVAATSLPVLLTGESGTGKEIVASSLHRRSNRSDKPFVPVNCGAIPAELIESELFGHIRGSFTGAERDRRGLWEAADGGTVFLDEITETNKSFQVKLLRVLQEGELRRVGSNVTQRVDVRVIAASNRDVEEEVRAGRFREDLFYRLNAVSIVLPPLRERKEDILPLATKFARRAFSSDSKPRFSPGTVTLLEAYPWPGNIRELENAVLRAATLSRGMICEHDLPERVRNYNVIFEPEERSFESDILPLARKDEWPSRAEIEARYVQLVLNHTAGNKQAAARLLEVDRKTLDRMLKRQDSPSVRVAQFRSRAA